jgi:hypothetical protein
LLEHVRLLHATEQGVEVVSNVGVALPRLCLPTSYILQGQVDKLAGAINPPEQPKAQRHVLINESTLCGFPDRSVLG